MDHNSLGNGILALCCICCAKCCNGDFDDTIEKGMTFVEHSNSNKDTTSQKDNIQTPNPNKKAMQTHGFYQQPSSARDAVERFKNEGKSMVPGR